MPPEEKKKETKKKDDYIITTVGDYIGDVDRTKDVQFRRKEAIANMLRGRKFVCKLSFKSEEFVVLEEK